METRQKRLPYVDNAIAILITLAINLITGFLFSWLMGVTYVNILWETVFCVCSTTIIDLWIVYASLKKMRAAGAISIHVPTSSLMQKLPRNPIALGAVFILFFGLITTGLNALVLWFFDLTPMALAPWMVYKLIYTTILSTKIIEYAIFCYVQPDWAETTATSQPPSPGQGTSVKNPLPKISVFKEMYASVTGNIGMNIITGTVLGGVVTDAATKAVVIYPTTVQGMPITGLLFGLIVGILVTRSITKAIQQSILSASGEGGELPPPDKRFTWMPKKTIPLTCLVCAGMMIFSAVALWGILTLFGLSVMTFYQSTILITIYASLTSKPLSHVLVRRCTQPDYITYIIAKKSLPSQTGADDSAIETRES